MIAHSSTSRLLAFVVLSACMASTGLGDVQVHHEAADSPAEFAFASIASPAINDAGFQAKWTIVRGRADGNSGAVTALADGQLPSSDDSPSENFFFAAGSDGGSLLVDFGSLKQVQQIVTYSRHASVRSPQVYSVHAATGDAPGFSTSNVNLSDPTAGGWKLVAKVDTRPLRRQGTQHAAAITDADKPLGEYRYLRFDVAATETRDAFGHTFFSEIDILTDADTDVQRVSVPKRQVLSFASTDDRYKFTIDTAAAPELNDWSERELKPVIQAWYPKIVDMLPSDNFEAAKRVHFQFLPADKMRGIPAWAQNATVSMNAGWFRGELKREALGAVVHEMVHVVQDYKRAGRGNRATPGWIVEGIPDYVRWFLYEPTSNGAALSKSALSGAKHDASYRTTANFIDWVIRTYDRHGDLLVRLNSAARAGKYTTDIWHELTGKTEEELANEWRGQ